MHITFKGCYDPVQNEIKHSHQNKAKINVMDKHIYVRMSMSVAVRSKRKVPWCLKRYERFTVVKQIPTYYRLVIYAIETLVREAMSTKLTGPNLSVT